MYRNLIFLCESEIFSTVHCSGEKTLWFGWLWAARCRLTILRMFFLRDRGCLVVICSRIVKKSLNFSAATKANSRGSGHGASNRSFHFPYVEVVNDMEVSCLYSSIGSGPIGFF